MKTGIYVHSSFLCKCQKTKSNPCVHQELNVQSMVTIVCNTTLQTCKLLTEQILKVPITRKNLCDYVWWQMLPRLSVIIILQHIQISNVEMCCTSETNVMFCMSITPHLKQKNKNRWVHKQIMAHTYNIMLLLLTHVM